MQHQQSCEQDNLKKEVIYTVCLLDFLKKNVYKSVKYYYNLYFSWSVSDRCLTQNSIFTKYSCTHQLIFLPKVNSIKSSA